MPSPIQNKNVVEEKNNNEEAKTLLYPDPSDVTPIINMLTLEYLLDDLGQLRMKACAVETKNAKRSSNANDQDYDSLIDAYLQLKKHAIDSGIFTPEGMGEIEQIAMNNVRQEFFLPEYQQNFNVEKDIISLQTSLTYSQSMEKAKRISEGYLQRNLFHSAFTLGLGLGSAISPGLLTACITSLVLQVIDMMVTFVRVAVQIYKANKALADHDMKISTLRAETENDLGKDPKTKFSQGFFKLAQNYKSHNLEIPNQDPPLVRPLKA